MAIYFHEYSMVIVTCVAVAVGIYIGMWLLANYYQYSANFISGITGVYVDDIRGADSFGVDENLDMDNY